MPYEINSFQPHIFVDEERTVEREPSPRAGRHATGPSRWDGLSLRVNGEPHFDQLALRRSIFRGIDNKELAPMVVTGRFDHDDTKRSLPAQPCMEPFDSDPFQESGPYQGYTDADFCRVLLNEPSSSSLREENCFEDTQPLTVDEMLQSQNIQVTPDAGPSGETSTIPQVHEPITEGSFNELKFDLSRLEYSSPLYKTNNRVNSIIDHLRNIIFNNEYLRSINPACEYISFKTKEKFSLAEINERYYKYLSPDSRNKIDVAVFIFNKYVEDKKDDILRSNIDIFKILINNKSNMSMKKISKNAGYEDNYCYRNFKLDGSLKPTGYSFINDLKTNKERRSRWNLEMIRHGFDKNIIN